MTFSSVGGVSVSLFLGRMMYDESFGDFGNGLFDALPLFYDDFLKSEKQKQQVSLGGSDPWTIPESPQENIITLAAFSLQLHLFWRKKVSDPFHCRFRAAVFASAKPSVYSAVGFQGPQRQQGILNSAGVKEPWAPCLRPGDLADAPNSNNSCGNCHQASGGGR